MIGSKIELDIVLQSVLRLQTLARVRGVPEAMIFFIMPMASLLSSGEITELKSNLRKVSFWSITVCIFWSGVTESNCQH